MPFGHTLDVTTPDEPIALRLLSALVLGWDDLPAEIQVRLLGDAALLRNGFPNSTVLPAKLMGFVDKHKRQRPQGPAASAIAETLSSVPYVSS
jgi:hypothetical protein